MNRRDFLRRTIPLTVAIPVSGGLFALLKNYFFPPRPDLRTIGCSIYEHLGFLVFNPSGVQRLQVEGRFNRQGERPQIYTLKTNSEVDKWLDKVMSTKERIHAGQLFGESAPGCLSI